MENVEVSVFNPNAIKVWGGEGSSMKGGGVLAMTLASHAYEVSIFVDASIADVASCLSESFLVEENDGVQVGLSPIVQDPPFTRVIGVLEVASQGRCEANGLRGGSRPSNSGVVLSEAEGLIGVDTVFAHVGVNEVNETRDEEKVLYCFEITIGGFKGFVVEPIIA